MVKNYRSCLYPLTTSSHLIRRLFLSLPVSLQLPTIKRKEQRNGGNELIAWGKDDRRQFHARLSSTVRSTSTAAPHMIEHWLWVWGHTIAGCRQFHCCSAAGGHMIDFACLLLLIMSSSDGLVNGALFPLLIIVVPARPITSLTVPTGALLGRHGLFILLFYPG